jgi:hypothetical protein
MNIHFKRITQIVICSLIYGLAQASPVSFDGDQVASNDELESMRGGFEINANGLRLLLSFSIESLNYINGALVSSTVLNPVSLTQLNASDVGIASSSAAVSGATVTSIPLTRQALSNAQFGSVTVIQNGAGNTFVLPQSLSSISTIIQNSVNDQVIQNLTTLNVTLAARQAAAQMSLNSALNQAISRSIR